MEDNKIDIRIVGDTLSISHGSSIMKFEKRLLPYIVQVLEYIISNTNDDTINISCYNITRFARHIISNPDTMLDLAWNYDGNVWYTYIVNNVIKLLKTFLLDSNLLNSMGRDELIKQLYGFDISVLKLILERINNGRT